MPIYPVRRYFSISANFFYMSDKHLLPVLNVYTRYAQTPKRALTHAQEHNRTYTLTSTYILYTNTNTHIHLHTQAHTYKHTHTRS